MKLILISLGVSHLPRINDTVSTVFREEGICRVACVSPIFTIMLIVG